jgi:hypothetical protein
LTGNQRQQCPQRHRGRDEQEYPEQDAAYDGFVPDVTAPGAQGRDEAFPAALELSLRPSPEEQGDREHDSAHGVEREDDWDATQVGDHEPGQRRPDRAGCVHADQIQAGRCS